MINRVLNRIDDLIMDAILFVTLPLLDWWATRGMDKEQMIKDLREWMSEDEAV